MPTEYTNLVTALKALTQGESPNLVRLPMAEDDWNTRPETVSYGTVSLDYEVDALHGDNSKWRRHTKARWNCTASRETGLAGFR